MVDKSGKSPAKEEPEGPAETTPPAKAGFFARFLTRKWLFILIGGSIILHAAGLAYYRLRPRTEPASNAEVSLGNFHFEADKAEGGRIAKADFSLHIALLEPVDPLAKQRLASRKYHVQQEVEELLRKAHSGDFEDPGLQELKRQLLEQINQALNLRAVGEIIITDLNLNRPDGRAVALAHSKQSPPFDEPASDKPAATSAVKPAAPQSTSGGLADAEAR